MAWVAEEKFDSYSDGTLDGNNGGSGFSVAWGVGAFNPTAGVVQGTTTYQGAKALSYTGTGGWYSARTLTDDISGAFVLYVAVRAAQTNGGGARFGLRNTLDQGRVSIQFDAVDGGGTVGNLQIIGSGGSPYTAINLVTYSANTWYVIRITGNTSTGTYTAAYSTDVFDAVGTFGSESSAATMFNSGDLRYVFLNTENTTADYFFDYISPTSPFEQTVYTLTASPLALSLTVNDAALRRQTFFNIAKPTTSIANVSKPSTSFANTSKPTFGYLWGETSFPWLEDSPWDDVYSGLTNMSKPS